MHGGNGLTGLTVLKVALCFCRISLKHIGSVRVKTAASSVAKVQGITCVGGPRRYTQTTFWKWWLGIRDAGYFLTRMRSAIFMHVSNVASFLSLLPCRSRDAHPSCFTHRPQGLSNRCQNAECRTSLCSIIATLSPPETYSQLIS